MLLRLQHLFNCLKQRRYALAAWIAHRRFVTMLTPAEVRLKRGGNGVGASTCREYSAAAPRPRGRAHAGGACAVDHL